MQLLYHISPIHEHMFWLHQLAKINWVWAHVQPDKSNSVWMIYRKTWDLKEPQFHIFLMNLKNESFKKTRLHTVQISVGYTSVLVLNIQQFNQLMISTLICYIFCYEILMHIINVFLLKKIIKCSENSSYWIFSAFFFIFDAVFLKFIKCCQ